MAHRGGRPHGRFSRGQSRGRGRGRGGRGVTTSHHGPRFKTSRLEEDQEASDVENPPQESSVSEEELEEEPQSMSEDEEPAARQSYSALLEVLKAERTQDEPARKRRKIDPAATNGKSVGTVTNQTKEQDLASEETARDVALDEDVEEEEDRLLNGEEIPDSEDEDAISRDPFDQHFASIDESTLKEAIAKQQEKQIRNIQLSNKTRKQSVFYGDNTESPTAIRSVRDLSLKGRLRDAGAQVFRALGSEDKDLLGEIADYRDVQYGVRRTNNASRLRDIASLHILNHVFKTRDRVLKNNAKLSQYEGSDALDLRDQGFTRPKVLIIVPTKQACVRFVESIIKVSEPDQQENKSRFLETFSQEDDETWDNKPEDFQELFGGNHEEDFRVGLKFTRKTIKYFSGFYNSDIVLGSALGLMRTITTGGGGKDKKKGHDADFLSSIEIVIVDHGAAIQMQNFQHLEYVFTQLNQLPKDSHGCDFARIRNWYLDGHAKHLRQTISFTAHHTPELNSLFSNHTFNINGITKYTPTYEGSMLTLPASLSAYTIPQTFLRFDSSSPQTDSDARFKFFTTTILPTLLRHNAKGVLVFIPSYVDFVRVRNHLSTSVETTSLSFGSLSEYTNVRDTARARSHFMNQRYSALIYSERAHHHFRYRIKGVKKIVFYGVPENPIFWAEIVGYLGLDPDMTELDSGGGKKGGKGVVRALFSKWDVLKMERIVGTERVGRLVSDRGGDTFEFV